MTQQREEGIATGTDGFFAASNSGCGFRNYYNDVFGGADRIIVVKGGPGTGKSRFIRNVAEHAADCGWVAEYYYCSSDPSSLDGVLLRKDGDLSAVIDGTPPHPWEPSLPGVRDTIVNLGDFWDVSVLIERRDEIREINDKKTELWTRAYKWLSGCFDMCDVISGIGAGLADTVKIKSVTEKILEDVPYGAKPSVRTALIWSVGMRGLISSDEYIKRAKKLYCVFDSYMTASILIRAVMDEALRRRLSVLISYDPVDSSQADGIFIESGDGGISVVVVKEPPAREYIPLSMEDIIKPADSIRAVQAAHAARCREAMLAGAIDTLGEIKKHHFRLEEIYSGAMDFAAVNAFTERFCKKYFS